MNEAKRADSRNVRSRVNPVLRERARAMRREPTKAEGHMWSLLRARHLGGFKFRRQHVIGPFIVDFVSVERKLVIEVDGDQHAESLRDQRRDLWLKARGYRVLRFWNNEVLENSDGVEFAIAEALGLDWLP